MNSFLEPPGPIAQKPADPMQTALAEARAAGARGEVPVGAVVLGPAGDLLAKAGNRVEAENDACAHAELLALRAAAAAAGNARLPGCDLWVTLEPCPMCASAAGLFRVRRIIFGAYDARGGGIEHNSRVFDRPGTLPVPEIIGGVRSAECGALLTEFFQARRR